MTVANGTKEELLVGLEFDPVEYVDRLPQGGLDAVRDWIREHSDVQAIKQALTPRKTKKALTEDQFYYFKILFCLTILFAVLLPLHLESLSLSMVMLLVTITGMTSLILYEPRSPSPPCTRYMDKWEVRAFTRLTPWIREKVMNDEPLSPIDIIKLKVTCDQAVQVLIEMDIEDIQKGISQLRDDRQYGIEARFLTTERCNSWMKENLMVLRSMKTSRCRSV